METGMQTPVTGHEEDAAVPEVIDAAPQRLVSGDGVNTVMLPPAPVWMHSEWKTGTSGSMVDTKARRFDVMSKTLAGTLIAFTASIAIGLDCIHYLESTYHRPWTDAILDDFDDGGMMIYPAFLLGFILVGTLLASVIALAAILIGPRVRPPKGLVGISADDAMDWLDGDGIMIHAAAVEGEAEDMSSLCWTPSKARRTWMLYWSAKGQGDPQFVGYRLSDAAEWPFWVQTEGDRIRFVLDSRYRNLTDWLAGENEEATWSDEGYRSVADDLSIMRMRMHALRMDVGVDPDPKGVSSDNGAVILSGFGVKAPWSEPSMDSIPAGDGQE